MPEGGKATPVDEDDLLRRARRLDGAALSAIFDIYYEPLYRYIYHLVGHGSTAEDLAAEVFRRFLDQLNKGRGPTSSLKPWLYQVSHNLAMDELRRRKYQNHEPLDEDRYVIDSSVSEQAHQTIMQQRARFALQRLTSKQQAVLTLKFLQGFDNEEIARVLNVNIGTVKALQHRGLNAMRRYLTRTGAFNDEDL